VNGHQVRPIKVVKIVSYDNAESSAMFFPVL